MDVLQYPVVEIALSPPALSLQKRENLAEGACQSRIEEKEDPGRHIKSCIHLKNDFPVEVLQPMKE